MRNALLALAVSASLFQTASARAAQPASPPPAQPASPQAAAQQTPDQARADAQKRLSEGLDRYSRGDYDGARLAFEQAYAVLTSVDLLYNLSRAEVKSGHALEAIVHLRQILRDPKATEDDHTKAARLLEDANRVTAHIAIEAPAGAEILIDHVPSGEAPLSETFDVPAGKHLCEARANGATRVIEIVASEGNVVTARFALDAARAPTVSAPVPMAPPPAPERKAAQAPPSDAQGRTVQHHDRESNARIVVPIVIGAVAVVAVGVGVGMGLVSKGKENDAADFRASNPVGFCGNASSSLCTRYASILNSQQQATDVERGFLIGGGVLAVGAVVTYLVWPHEHRSEGGAMWIAPAPGGAVLGGTF